MRSRILFVAMAFLCVLCFSPMVHGQSNGSFSGTVLDKSGSVITGAKITVTSQGTGAVRDGLSDEAGHYLIPLLPVGIYTLHVEFSGFQTSETKDVRLQVDEQREVDFTLAPSSVSSTVEVSAAEVAVETTNASLGQVITAQQVTQLPLNGRDFVQLATLTPGTTAETNTSSFFTGAASSEVAARGSFSLSVGGSRPNSTDWLLDGMDNNELTAGGISILSSIDSIQEFKVLTYDYSAEYGYRAGPTVLVTTKSGSNEFHGSLFEFFRNTSLDASSFFAILPEKFNLNQFGGGIGGPIRKNKTFFFLDGEQKYQRKGITFTGLLPTEAMRNGDFSEDPFGNPVAPGAIVNPNVNTNPNSGSTTPFQCTAAGVPIPANPDGSQAPGTPCNKIPSNLINPIAQQMINLYPLPNASNSAHGFNFVNEPVRALDETKFDIRVDHSFSAADNMYARFSYDQANSVVPGGGGPGSFAEANAFGSNQIIINHARNVTLSETHVFTPNTVNQISGGYNRIFDYISSQGTGTCTAAMIGIPGANLDCNAANVCAPQGISCGLTSTQFDGGFWALGDRGFSPFVGGTNVFVLNDSLDMIRGKHDIKVGLGIRANQMNVRTEGFQDGFWVVSGAWTDNPEADFLLGLPSLAIHDQTFEGSTTGRRWKTFRPFVQDDWRVTPNLTVNLGLAWNLTSPISEVDNRQANFNPANGQFLIAGNTPFGPNAGKWVGVNYDKDALEPRIGVAWKPRGSDRTVIRAGYAIIHDSSWSQGAQGLWQNAPYYAESDRFGFGGNCTFATAACAATPGNTPSAISLSDGFQIFTAPPDPASFTGTIQSQNLGFKLGMVQQYNATVEREVPGQILITAAYVGSHSSHILIDGNNLNVTTPAACGVAPGYTLGCGPDGAALPIPYPAFPFSTIANISDQGRASYNSFQVKAETKSSRHGIYALIAYTYAHTHDNGLSDGLGSSIGATYYPLPNWNRLDWALSQINLNNDFTASVIYDLPFGRGKHFGSDWNGPLNTILGDWQATTIVKITSGFPVFVVNSSNGSGVNFENNGNSLNRPDIVGNPNKGGAVAANPLCVAPASVHNSAAWFNPCAFAPAAAGELGDASRTPLSGPDFVNTDFSLIKQFRLPWENLGLSFRAEFFNLFNHPQFALPVQSIGYADINAANFGSISSTVNNPRLVQFALKLTF
jgi:Carboxypeptidase regulatory-like domain